MDESILKFLQVLTIFFLTILPILCLILLMSLDIKPLISKTVTIFLLLVLPALLILSGVVFGVENFDINIFELTGSWYFIISVVWFAQGIIFYSAIE